MILARRIRAKAIPCEGVSANIRKAPARPASLTPIPWGIIKNINPTYSDFGPQKQNFTKFDFLFGFGRTRIVANRIIFDYGFNVNFFAFMTGFFDTVDLGNDGAFFDKTPDALKYMDKTNGWRLRGFNRFNAFLKVGFLLF